MKFIRKISIIFFLITLLLTKVTFAKSGVINVDAARLREKANTESEILTNIYQDEKVEVLGEEADWYKIKYEGKTGYVKSQFVTLNKEENKVEENKTEENKTEENKVEEKTTEPTSETAPEPEKPKVMISLRNVPSITSVITSTIEFSTELTELSSIGNWIEITDGTNSGWILKTKFENTLNQVQTQPTPEPEKPQNTNTTVEPSNTNTTINNTTSETTVNRTGVVNVETANVREQASTSAEIAGTLDYEDKVTIVSETEEWYKITTSKVSGYVSKKLITVSDGNEVTSRSMDEQRKQEDTTTVDENKNNSLTSSLNNSNRGNEVAEYVKSFLGCSYVSGGKNPKTGFDCSGFTKYVYENFGYTLGNTAASQASSGTDVSRENLEVGDLLLFYNEGKTMIGHTGVYVGNGNFVHAANSDRGVVIDNLNTNSYYNERFVTGKRIVN